jgi:hypothetical protein
MTRAVPTTTDRSRNADGGDEAAQAVPPEARNRPRNWCCARPATRARGRSSASSPRSERRPSAASPPSMPPAGGAVDRLRNVPDAVTSVMLIATAPHRGSRRHAHWQPVGSKFPTAALATLELLSARWGAPVPARRAHRLRPPPRLRSHRSVDERCGLAAAVVARTAIAPWVRIRPGQAIRSPALSWRP